MKYITFVLTIVFLMMTSMGAKAQDISYENCVAVDGLGYALDKTNHTATVVRSTIKDAEGNPLCEEYEGDVVVPETITVEGVNYTVTALGESAFAMADITSLKLPSTIKKLEFRAVSFCLDLKKANLPASVEEMGQRSFSCCPKLENFIVDEGNTHFVLESNMLMNADRTRVVHLFGAGDVNKSVSVSVPSTVKTIDEGAFDYSLGLNAISLPEGLEEIKAMAFLYTGLTSLTIPSTVTFIGEGFVQDSQNLKEIVVAEGNKSYKMEDGMLLDADMTKLYRVLPECKTLTIPETVTRICKGAIEFTNLKTLVIPNTVKEMAEFAVCYNEQLKTLVIGNGLNVIETYTFFSNNALQSIFVRGNQPVAMQQYAFYGEALEEKATLYVPEGSKELYATAANWENFKNIKEYSLAGIDQHPGEASAESVAVDGIAYDLNREDMTATVVENFYFDDNLNMVMLCPEYSGDIVIPDEISVDNVEYTVTDIGEYAFSQNQLNSVTLPSTLKAIRNGAFSFVEQLQTLKLPASLELIEDCAFSFSDDLKTLQIEDGNKCYAFEDHMLMSADKTKVYAVIGLTNADAKAEIVVPATVKSIENNSFYGSYGVVGVTLPEGLETIGDMAFSYTNITSMHIPASVTYIEDAAFWFTDKLQKMTVDEDNMNYAEKNGMLLTKDLTHLLDMPSMLEVFNIPETVTNINEYAVDMINTNELVIPDGVKVLGEWSLSMNDMLETLIVGSGVETWGNLAFLGCYNLKSIYLRSKNVVTPEGEPFVGDVYDNATLYVPAGTKGIYEGDPYWKQFRNIVEYTPAGIDNVKAQNNSADGQVYGIDGVRRNSMRRGLNIVRSSGKVRKVIKT